MILAERVARIRERRGWSQRELAKQLTSLGFPTARSTVTKIEAGGTRAANVSVTELFALAVALGVAPVHLVTPNEDDVDVQIAPTRAIGAADAREWIAGRRLLEGADPAAFMAGMPTAQAQALARVALTREMSPMTLAVADQEELDRRAADVVWEITEGDRIREQEGAGNGE